MLISWSLRVGGKKQLSSLLVVLLLQDNIVLKDYVFSSPMYFYVELNL